MTAWGGGHIAGKQPQEHSFLNLNPMLLYRQTLTCGHLATFQLDDGAKVYSHCIFHFLCRIQSVP